MHLAERLSPREWSIIGTAHRLRLVTGLQFERLHFHQLTGRSRSVKRWQVVKRLVDLEVLIPMERDPRVRMANRGSGGLCYALDSRGQRLVRLRPDQSPSARYVRRPRVTGDKFTEHILTVSELYVSLDEESRSGRFTVGDFQVEGAAYCPDGLGGWLKVDAYTWLERPGVTDYWWYEAELAIKSGPAIERKLQAHLDFVQRGQLGPDGIAPRVMVGVEKPKQQAKIQAVVDGLSAPAEELFVVASLQDVPRIMVNELMK